MMKIRTALYILLLGAVILLSACEKLVEYGEGRYLCENGELTYLENYGGVYIHWSDEVTAEQQEVIREMVMNMVRVEGGSFVMGAQSANQNEDNYDAAASEDEQPVHRVNLSNFYIGKFEVTQRQWETITGVKADWSPGYGLGNTYPAYNVNYADVVNFIAKLNHLTGLNFRLPTEAEWEYAARGGVNTHHYSYSGGDLPQNVAWYNENANYTTHEVGTKFSNELGLFDMSGNACEWCADYYETYSFENQTNPTGPATGDYRVVRGGSFCYREIHSRCTARDYFNAEGRSIGIGFRLALSE